jgi:hypothetical protein
MPRSGTAPDFPPDHGVGEHRAVSGEKSPAERVLDVFVFAPLGLAATARDELPKLADEGRKQVERQLKTARLVGEYTVRRLRRRADAALVELGLGPAREQASPPSSPPPAAGDLDAEPAVPAAGNGQVRVSGAARPDAYELAIPGYDTLSASQVVQRLSGLSHAELEAVRAYEEAGRGRKTVLTKVAQLQAATR